MKPGKGRGAERRRAREGMALAGSPSPGTESHSDKGNVDPNTIDALGAANADDSSALPSEFRLLLRFWGCPRLHLRLCVVNVVGGSAKCSEILQDKQATTITEALQNNEISSGRGLNQQTTIKSSGDTHWSSYYVLSGVQSFLSCISKRLRGKGDVIKAGVAGCCTGLILSYPGEPQALLQNCLSFVAFTCLFEWYI